MTVLPRFSKKIGNARSAWMVPKLSIVPLRPRTLTASAMLDVPAEYTLPPAWIVTVPLLPNSTVLLPVPDRPQQPPPVFCTSPPLPMVMAALSPTLIAFALLTMTCAPEPTVTVVPEAVLDPLPIVLVKGLGALLSQVTVVPLVVQLACTA